MIDTSWDSSAPRSLDAALERYGRDAARWTRTAAVPASARLARWTAYAAAGGGALAWAEGAQAAVVYSGPKNITLQLTNQNSGRLSYSINMDSLGAAEFSAYVTANSVLGSFSAELNPLSVNTGALAGAGSESVAFLPAGAAINFGAAAAASASNGNIIDFATSNGTMAAIEGGTWPQGQTGFAGVRFAIGGQNHFGWIRMRWDDNIADPLNLIDSLTIFDWAFEDVAETTILAGDGIPSAVPEPGSALLTLLAAGATGVIAWKRRRARRHAEGRPASATARDGEL